MVGVGCEDVEKGSDGRGQTFNYLGIWVWR